MPAAFAALLKNKGAITALVVLVLVVVGVLVVVLWRGLRDVFEGINDLGSGAGKVVGDVSSIAGDVTGVGAKSTRIFASVFDTPETNPSGRMPEDFSPDQSDLILHKVIKTDGQKTKFIGTGWVKVKTLYAELRVTDENGTSVGGAVVHAKPLFGPTRVAEGIREWTTTRDGFVTIRFDVANVPLTEAEDDLLVWATKDGYNPSNEMILR